MMSASARFRNNGFSLVEMLIAVAIVVILSSFVLAHFVAAKANARDADRVESIRQLKNAITLYEHSRSVFPICNPEIVINGTADCLSMALIADNVIGMAPTDPLGGSSGSCGAVDEFVYCYQSVGGKSYNLRYHLETNSIKASGWYSETQ